MILYFFLQVFYSKKLKVAARIFKIWGEFDWKMILKRLWQIWPVVLDNLGHRFDNMFCKENYPCDQSELSRAFIKYNIRRAATKL